MTSKFNLLFKRPLFVAIKVNLLSSFQFCKKIPNLVDFVLQVTVSRKIIEDANEKIAKFINIVDFFIKFIFSSIIYVMKVDVNRIKIVLVEKKRTNKWLAEQLGKDPATVSKWCTNSSQPQLETLINIADILGVSIADLVNSTKASENNEQ